MAQRRAVDATVAIVDLDDEGAGLGVVDGRSVQVFGAFPGERVDVTVQAWSRHHPRAFAQLRKVIDPHPARRSAPCVDHRQHKSAGCTGCPLQSLELAAQLQALQQSLVRRYGWPLQRIESDDREWGYRWSAKRVCARSFDREPGHLILGSHQLQSHTVAAMDHCRVDHPRLIAAFAAVQTAARRLAIEPYDEQRRSGDLRYVWAKTNGQDVLVTLICSDESSRAAQTLPAELAGNFNLAWSVQKSHGNAIRGTAPHMLAGAATVDLTLFGKTQAIGPLGFLQPNPPMAARAYQALIRDANDQALRGDLAFDLYAGAGLTTAGLRETFTQVVPCESYPESAAALGVDAQDAASFLTARAQAGEPYPSAIVANPPRAGMGAEVCHALCQITAPHLNIMSCSASSLAADLSALAASYDLVSLRGFATLPHTPHVEFVAHLRAKAAKPCISVC